MSHAHLSFSSSMRRMRGAASLHPLIAAAAVCLIIMSGVAVGVMTGVLPSPSAKTAEVDTRAERETVASRFGRASEPAPIRRVDEPRRTESMPVAVQRCADCGVVQSVQAIKVAGQGTGVGAVGGGVVGGLVGNQFGGGNGRTALTLLGAAGGAYAGHEIEKNVRSTTRYQMKVRMDNGTVRTFTNSTGYNWSEGDAVRIVNGRIVARGSDAESSTRAIRVNG